MSWVVESFNNYWWPQFNAHSVKVMTKGAMIRLKNRTLKLEEKIKQNSRELIKLWDIEKKKEAYVHVEEIIRDTNYSNAQRQLQLFLEQFESRLLLIAEAPQADFPDDCVEALQTILFASQYLDCDELHQIRDQVALKFKDKKEFAQYFAQMNRINPKIKNQLTKAIFDEEEKKYYLGIILGKPVDQEQLPSMNPQLADEPDPDITFPSLPTFDPAVGPPSNSQPKNRPNNQFNNSPNNQFNNPPNNQFNNPPNNQFNNPSNNQFNNPSNNQFNNPSNNQFNYPNRDSTPRAPHNYNDIPSFAPIGPQSEPEIPTPDFDVNNFDALPLNAPSFPEDHQISRTHRDPSSSNLTQMSNSRIPDFPVPPSESNNQMNDSGIPDFPLPPSEPNNQTNDSFDFPNPPSNSSQMNNSGIPDFPLPPSESNNQMNDSGIPDFPLPPSESNNQMNDSGISDFPLPPSEPNNQMNDSFNFPNPPSNSTQMNNSGIPDFPLPPNDQIDDFSNPPQIKQEIEDFPSTPGPSKTWNMTTPHKGADFTLPSFSDSPEPDLDELTKRFNMLKKN